MSDQMIGLLTGSAHLLLSVFLAVITTYGSFRIIDRLIGLGDYTEGLKSNHIAMSIVLGGVLVACSLIVRSSMEPAVSSLQVFLFREFSWLQLLKLGFLTAGYILLAIVLANVCIWVAMRCFLWLTRNLDELAEIRSNNIAVAITVGVTVAIMGLFISDGLSSLMQALVPFPAFRPIEVLGG